MSEPVSGERIVVVDVLRAFALSGIIVTHAATGFLAGPAPDPDYMIFSTMDRAVSQLETLFCFGKFYTVFSFLFGLSFAIQLENATRKGTVFAYALSMARNALVDDARRRRGMVPEEAAAALPDLGAGPLDRLMGEEDTRRIRQELARLPAETRELLMLRFGDGLRFAEIAQVMGLNEAAVRQRTSRAVRELRARWDAGPERGALANDG